VAQSRRKSALLRVGAWRFVLSAAYVGSGNVLGIEAPTLHLCAAVASGLHCAACVVSERISCCFRVGKDELPLFTNEGLPQAVVLGCAAGLSAAFGSPLAAVSYAVEEYVDVRQTGTVTALVLLSSLSAALVRRGFEPHAGSGGLSVPAIGNALAGGGADGDTRPGSTEIWPWLITATVAGVVLGTLSPMLMAVVLRLRRASFVKESVRVEIFLGGLAGLLTGVLGYAAYLLTGCESAWGIGKIDLNAQLDASCDTVRHSAGTPQPLDEVLVMLLLSAGKLLSFCACFAMGGAGGVLMPSLVIGAMLGRCTGLAFSGLDAALPNAGAVLGMAAFFGANMRLPLTAAGVALEYATGNMESYDARLVCTIPLAAALGTWVASWWDSFSIFERMMLQDGIDPETLSQQIKVMVHGCTEGGAAPAIFPSSRRDSIQSNCTTRSATSSVARRGEASASEVQSSSRTVMAAARRRSVLTIDVVPGPYTGVAPEARTSVLPGAPRRGTSAHLDPVPGSGSMRSTRSGRVSFEDLGTISASPSNSSSLLSLCSRRSVCDLGISNSSSLLSQVARRMSACDMQEEEVSRP